MKFSIVLPTYNRLDRLQRVLAALEMQSYSLNDFEVVVVSDGSSDGTNEFLNAFKTPLDLTPVLQDNQGVAVARNSGVAQAKGELILFVDDDVVPTPDLLVEHLKVHEANGKDSIVMGPMLTPPDFAMQPWVNWEQTMLMKQYDDMNAGKWQPTARQFYTGNTSLRKQHVIDAGGFDPNFRRAEDVELAYRLADKGLQFYFNMDAVGYHYAERSFASWIAIPYSYGCTDVVLTKEHGQQWLLPTVAREFHGRHPTIQTITRSCLDKEALSKFTINTLKKVAWLGHTIGISTLPRFAYSGIFNLRYYQGVSDSLGSAKLFLKLITKS